MKNVKMMYLTNCPYCKQAFAMMQSLCEKNSAYAKVHIETIEEEKEETKTQGYDYYYVPTYFVGNEKVHEGVPTMEKMEEVLKKAIEEE